MSQARTNARKAALQAVYQWQMAGQSLIDISNQFDEDDLLKDAQRSYFFELLKGIMDNQQTIDQTLAEFTDRPVAAVDPVERAILRIGAYELLHRIDLPFRVILNEAINLAKIFGADGSHKYINGILDKIAQKNRTIEMKVKMLSK